MPCFLNAVMESLWGYKGLEVFKVVYGMTLRSVIVFMEGLKGSEDTDLYFFIL